jgi:hypothetical protein
MKWDCWTRLRLRRRRRRRRRRRIFLNVLSCNKQAQVIREEEMLRMEGGRNVVHEKGASTHRALFHRAFHL